MKKSLLTSVLAAVLVVSCGTQNAKVSELEAQKEVLELNTKLTKLKIDYEKEKVTTDDLRNKGAAVNAQANTATTDFSSSDAKATAKDAKQTMKVLKETEKINRDLASSEKKLHKLEKEIAKVQGRLDQLNQQVKIVDKNTAEAESN